MRAPSLAALPLVLSAVSAGAQAPDTTPRATWVNIGIGPAAGAGRNGGYVTLGGSLSRAVRPERIVVGRVQYLEEFCVLWCDAVDGPEKVVALAVMYGPVVQRRWVSFAMTGGISALTAMRYEYGRDPLGRATSGRRSVMVGIPLDAQLHVRPFPVFGIGAGAHVDVNPLRTYASFTVGVQVGRFAR